MSHQDRRDPLPEWYQFQDGRVLTAVTLRDSQPKMSVPCYRFTCEDYGIKAGQAVKPETIAQAMRECKSFTEMFERYDVTDRLFQLADLGRMAIADATGEP